LDLLWPLTAGLLGIAAVMTFPILMLGLCGWRMADDVGLYTISEKMIAWALVQFCPFLFLLPGIYGTIGSRRYEIEEKDMIFDNGESESV